MIELGNAHKKKLYINLGFGILGFILSLFIIFLSANYINSHVKKFDEISTDATIDFVQADTTYTVKSSLDSMTITHVLISKPNSEKTLRLYYHQYPESLKWMLFHAVVIGLGFFFSILILRHFHLLNLGYFKSLKPNSNYIPVFYLLIPIFGILLLFTGAYTATQFEIIDGAEIMNYFGILFKDVTKIFPLILWPILIMGFIPLLLILYLFYYVLNKFFEESSLSPKGFSQLKNAFSIYSLYAACFIAVALIGSKLQKNMIAEYITNIDIIYPDFFIQIYAVNFTIVLAFFFIPTLLVLNHYKNKHNIVASNNDGKIPFTNVYLKSFDDIKVIFSIFIPIITSYFSS